MSENIVEKAAGAAGAVVKKPLSWFKAAPVIFVILIVVVGLLAVRYSEKIRTWLSARTWGRWLLGMKAAAAFLVAAGAAALRWLTLVMFLGIVPLGDSPRSSSGVLEPAAGRAPPCHLVKGKERCFVEALALPAMRLGAEVLR